MKNLTTKIGKSKAKERMLLLKKKLRKAHGKTKYSYFSYL